MSSLKLLRGLRALVTDAVEHGSRAVETIQKETAGRPFAVLEAIPKLAVPAKGVHLVHDAVVSVTHASIRGVNSVVGVALDKAIDLAESAADAEDAGAAAPAEDAHEERGEDAKPAEEREGREPR